MAPGLLFPGAIILSPLQFDIVRDLAEPKLEDAPRNKWRKKLPVPGAKETTREKLYGHEEDN